MKRVFLNSIVLLAFLATNAQSDKVVQQEKSKVVFNASNKAGLEPKGFTDSNYTLVDNIPATSVKNQGMTGTCWCFSSTSMLESQCIKYGLGNFDLSEMFTVRNTYLEKAKIYLLRQGHTQFGEGGLGHDLINAVAKYGAVPQSEYTGLLKDERQHNHVKLVESLKKYMDSIINLKTVPEKWMDGYTHILDSALGTPPEKFAYAGKEYTPKSFASDALKFNANDYVYITSFSHHPFYSPFVLEVPDNFSNGLYNNVPLEEMIQITKDALNSGFSVLWDADVSNNGFQQRYGAAVNFNNLPGGLKTKAGLLTGDVKEGKWDAVERQKLFENLTTQDDHLMHIVGLEKAKNGSDFFLVKNSWGDVGPDHGYINVSEGYFAINTISLVVPKAALSKKVLAELNIR